MGDFPPLQSESLVFRAIIYDNLIKKDGSVRWQAFKPRERDVDGVSVAFTVQDAASQFSDPIFGMTSVHVGRIREISHQEISLDVIQDEETHANIIGIPYIWNVAEDEKIRLEDIILYLCNQIVKLAAQKVEYEARA